MHRVRRACQYPRVRVGMYCDVDVRIKSRVLGDPTQVKAQMPAIEAALRQGQ